MTLRPGRPDLRSIVASQASAAQKLGIAVCGPLDMIHDVRSAGAEAQTRVLEGAASNEVHLHVETFGW